MAAKPDDQRRRGFNERRNGRLHVQCVSRAGVEIIDPHAHVPTLENLFGVRAYQLGQIPEHLEYRPALGRFAGAELVPQRHRLFGLDEPCGTRTGLPVDNAFDTRMRFAPDRNDVPTAAHRHTGAARHRRSKALDQALEQLDEAVARGSEIASRRDHLIGRGVFDSTIDVDRRGQSSGQRRRRRLHDQCVDTRTLLAQTVEVPNHGLNGLNDLAQL